MRISLLTEGDAETRDSWSGSALSTVQALRAAGHVVHCGDVDLYGLDRALTALLAFSPRRARWGVKYHLGAAAFAARSRVAARRLREHGGEVDVVLQIGATCSPRARGDVPLALYCDSNILLASHAENDGPAVSDFEQLSASEVEAITAREAAVYREADAVLTMSDRLRRSFVEDFGLDERKVHTVHAGPNFDPAHVPERPVRRSDAPPTVLFVGRAFARKGGDLLLRAFARVRADVPDARLVVVGPDDIGAAPPGVTCLGFVDKETPEGWRQLADAYANADVFCLPTRFEPFGIAFVEAMFFGLPCIGPDQWAVPEMIEDGVTGLLSPPGDEAALAERMRSLLCDPETAARMGAAGRSRARDHFTWPATIDRMTAVLRGITAERGGV